MVATQNDASELSGAVKASRRACVFTSHHHVLLSSLTRFVVSTGLALIGALTLVLLVDPPSHALAAQTCTTFATGQVYCLSKTDAVDPIRVGETQLFTIIESFTAGPVQIADPGPLTDIVPANYAITSAAATFVGSASGPPCTIALNTVTCPAPRTLGPGGGQIILSITAIAKTASTGDKKCDAVENTAFSSIPGLISNRVSEPTTILPEKGPTACGRKSTLEDDDEQKKETKEQKQGRRRTDNSNRDQIRAEGNVVGVRCKTSDPVPTVKRGFISEPDSAPYALIGNTDGVQQITLQGKAKSDCKLIQDGDYLKAEGEKEHEQLFRADEIEVKHYGKTIN
jgi:hypothetical protein